MKKKKKLGKTLPQLIHEFLAFRRVVGKQNTIIGLQTTLETFAFFCLNRELNPLETETVQKWATTLRAPVGGKRVRTGGTINVYIRRLKSFFNWGTTMGYFKRNPCALVNKFPVEGKYVRGFTADEVVKLVTAANADPYSWYWVPMILLGWHYGMRLEDCAKFGAQCVDWDRMTFRFTPRKQSRREIELPLHSDVTNAIKDIRIEDDQEYYFPLGAQRYTSNTLSKEFKRIVIAAGLPDYLTFHCLRHGAATSMIKAGIKLTSIVDIIGWSSTSMLQRYLDTDVDEVSKLTQAKSVIPAIVSVSNNQEASVPECKTP